MTYLLDTNTCIRYLNGRSPSVVRRVRALQQREAVLCSVVVAELLAGGRGSQTPEKTLAKQRGFIALFDSLPFDDACAEEYAVVRADLKAKGTPIGANDLMIAAIALTHNLTLVTHNMGEFGRVAGLKLEDWETDE
jgi:tRNA(fMet)-specific endonuclease VapC